MTGGPRSQRFAGDGTAVPPHRRRAGTRPSDARRMRASLSTRGWSCPFRPARTRLVVPSRAQVLAPLVAGEVAPRDLAGPLLPRVGIDVPGDDLSREVPHDHRAPVWGQVCAGGPAEAGVEGVSDWLPAGHVVEDGRAVEAGRDQDLPVVAEPHTEHEASVAGQRRPDRPGGDVDEDDA